MSIYFVISFEVERISATVDNRLRPSFPPWPSGPHRLIMKNQDFGSRLLPHSTCAKSFSVFLSFIAFFLLHHHRRHHHHHQRRCRLFHPSAGYYLLILLPARWQKCSFRLELFPSRDFFVIVLRPHLFIWPGQNRGHSRLDSSDDATVKCPVILDFH